MSERKSLMDEILNAMMVIGNEGMENRKESMIEDLFGVKLYREPPFKKEHGFPENDYEYDESHEDGECCPVCPEYEECLDYDFEDRDRHCCSYCPEYEDILTADAPVRYLAGESLEGDECKIVPMIKDVIFNDPATIVYWQSGEKTVVKTRGGEAFDKEKGLAMAILKYYGGNNGEYFNIFRKFCGAESDFHLAEKKENKK